MLARSKVGFGPILRVLLMVGWLCQTLPAEAGVDVEGLSRTTKKIVLASMALDDEPCNATESRVRRLYRQADRQILQALEVYGYYAPTIKKSLTSEGPCWVASFRVTRGPRVVLRRVNLTVSGAGLGDRGLTEGLITKALEVGDGLNQRAYDEFKIDLAALAQRRGYFEGRFAVSRVDVYPEQLAADIQVEFASGDRYRFGPVTMEQDVIKQELALRYVEFKPGEPYDADQVNDLYIALLAGGYFQNVELLSTPRPAPFLDVPLNIRLSPAPPKTWTTGVGYSSDTGARVRLNYLHQRLNTSGHQFEFNSSATQVLGEATLSYRLPLGNPRDEWLSVNTGYKYENPDNNRSEEFSLGVQKVKRLSQGWRETRSLSYIRENFVVGNEEGSSNLVLPGITWAFQPRLLPPRPRRAHALTFSVSGTDELLSSSTAFVQLETAGKIILPLWSTARVLIRGEVGWTIKDEFKDLPFSVRYFTGGDTSVRGYGYKTLGPTDSSGDVVGGGDILVGSVEFDQRVFGNWSVAAFMDMGNAFNSFRNMGLKTGVGAGFRWYSPLGPIRFDVGIPLSESPDSFRIHITLGPDL